MAADGLQGAGHPLLPCGEPPGLDRLAAIRRWALLFEGIPPGQLWYQDISITAPCDVSIGDKDTLIAMCAYANNAGVCAPECGDCNDPNMRPDDRLNVLLADTLIVTVIAAPPALGVLQDTLTLVDRGQTQAYIPFSICNQDECADPTLYGYNITSKGHVGSRHQRHVGSITVDGGECKDVYGVIDAGVATRVRLRHPDDHRLDAGTGCLRHLRSGHPRRRA